MIFSAPKSNSLLGLFLIAICSGSQAAENEENSQSLPDLEFLEFLGQFETDDGDWIEPSSLMANELDTLLEMATQISDPQSTDAESLETEESDSDDN